MLPLFAIYTLWMIWFCIWAAATLMPFKGGRKLNAAEEFLYRVITSGAALLLFTITPWPGLDVQYRLWQHTLNDAIAWRLVEVAGLAMFIASWALWHRVLVLRRGNPIVTTGPYALLRHPVYFCLTIAIFATAILFGRPSSFMGAGLLTLCFVVKTLVEETRSGSPAFAAYRSRTFMYLPILGLAIHAAKRWMPQRPRVLAIQEQMVSPSAEPLPEPSRSLRISTIPLEIFLDSEGQPGVLGSPSRTR